MTREELQAEVTRAEEMGSPHIMMAAPFVTDAKSLELAPGLSGNVAMRGPGVSIVLVRVKDARRFLRTSQH